MNGFYVYFDDGGKIYGGKNRRWVYCDNVKGITDTRDFYPLNDFIIDAVHVFNSAKSAQKFIDVDCKYFDEQPNLKISEIPNSLGEWYESKKTTKRSLKESNYDLINDDLLAMCKGSTKQLIYAIDDYQSNYSDRSLKELKRRIEEVEDFCGKILYQVNKR